MAGYPNFNRIIKRRIERINKIKADPRLIKGAWAYYIDKPIEFIQDWGITYDPRNAGTNVPTLMPFVPFPRQKEFIQFLYECLLDQANGAIEKCRDVGATWIAANFSDWLWRFHSGSAIGWGSRKEQLVDKIGDPDSIFEKIRMVQENMPSFLQPKGWNPIVHSSYMKIINPANGSTITGEAGDNIGRGGRKTIYFKDESAHYERPEKIEAALGDNTNVQIDISSVNGPATVFQRRIDAGTAWDPNIETPKGVTRVFIFDWRDHPLKTQEWYNERKKRAKEEGLGHIFAQEVDRDASAAVEGTLIPGTWVNAAVDAHIRLNIPIEGQTFGAFDVADGGKDKQGLAIRKGILQFVSGIWESPDVGVATQKALFHCLKNKVESFQYDSIGVGSGAKSEINRLQREGLLPKHLRTVGWAGSGKVKKPEARVIKGDKQSRKNKDFFCNLKAQGWWNLRLRFERTYKMIEGLAEYEEDELISLDSNMAGLHELKKELSQPTYSINGSGKMVVDKAPDGVKSPNRADSTMMSYWPRTRNQQVLL